ncbi:hypothetical protein XENOCAPTIV_023803 [Xenoophorus captivus]|uniref:Uncharacterized protein n=1 Tax=Xenoophorus captivus TaxID=1517983 RepID=A0ABV0RN12_9TELE
MFLMLISHSPSVLFRFPGPQLSHILLISSSPSSLVHTPLSSGFKFSGFHCSPLDSLLTSLVPRLCGLVCYPACVPRVSVFQFLVHVVNSLCGSRPTGCILVLPNLKTLHTDAKYCTYP